jgi:transcriptional activator of glycolytic enzymes GCR1
VVWMDHQFDTKWRSENKEKVFYSVRKTIIDHVEDRLRGGGESLDTVLKHLQGTMVARSKGLQALSAAIRNWQHPGLGRRRMIDAFFFFINIFPLVLCLFVCYDRRRESNYYLGQQVLGQ